MGLFKSKAKKELDELISEMKINLANNYKSTAHEKRKQLGIRCDALFAEGKISEKDYKEYKQIFEHYTLMLKDYHH